MITTAHSRYEIFCTSAAGHDILAHHQTKKRAFEAALSYDANDKFKECIIGIYDLMARRGCAEKWLVIDNEVVPVEWRRNV